MTKKGIFEGLVIGHGQGGLGRSTIHEKFTSLSGLSTILERIRKEYGYFEVDIKAHAEE